MIRRLMSVTIAFKILRNIELQIDDPWDSNRLVSCETIPGVEPSLSTGACEWDRGLLLHHPERSLFRKVDAEFLPVPELINILNIILTL